MTYANGTADPVGLQPTSLSTASGSPTVLQSRCTRTTQKQRSKLMSLWSTSPRCWVNQGLCVERPCRRWTHGNN